MSPYVIQITPRHSRGTYEVAAHSGYRGRGRRADPVRWSGQV